MPTLELLIDASGMQRGAQQAQTALRTVQAETTATEAKVVSTARQMGQGMLQASTGIVGAAASFGQLNAATGLFQSSRVLLDIGNMATGFRALTVAGTGLRGVISGIGLAISANPLGALATVLSTVALGMGLFGSETKKATGEFGKMVEAVAKARLDAETARFLGASTLSARQAGQQAIESGLPALPAGGMRVGDAAAALGLDRMDVIRFLAQQQGGDAAGAMAYVRTGRVPLGNSTADIARVFSSQAESGDASRFALSGDQLRNLFRQVYKFNEADIGRQVEYNRTASSLGPVGGGDTYDRAFADELYGDQRPGGGVRITAERQAQVNQENTERALRAMDELVAKGEQFGATIGNAFFNVASGTQTARQALQSLIADFARLASQQAFARFFGTAFGATAPQQNSNGGGFFSG